MKKSNPEINQIFLGLNKGNTKFSNLQIMIVKIFGSFGMLLKKIPKPILQGAGILSIAFIAIRVLMSESMIEQISQSNLLVSIIFRAFTVLAGASLLFLMGIFFIVLAFIALFMLVTILKIDNWKKISIGESILWILLCGLFPVGYARMGQWQKGIIWLLIVGVSFGFGAIAMLIDYFMCASKAQTDKPLKKWEWFPRI